ncbi:TonB-dependent receptor [uncultured Zobellia sp.]|uniref:SusC/RagA family TonB-linked outer membrane protein n=1 Tax=uncultured Zobellia sp. TaxID=255433 RepID=UPI0025921B36|nr:TonB-dependent receptor [uncultured Zobellia sp.]
MITISFTIYISRALCILSLLFGICTFAQDDQISGTVFSSDGFPLPGANVIQKGTTNGVVTDFDGKFSLTLQPDSDILEISYIGFEPQEVEIGTQRPISITLIENLENLDEVIVTGYGSQKKVDVTGSISTIKSKELTTVPTPTIAQSVAGRATGVFVQTKNAQPGDYDGVSYNIRGFGEALLIIDGMPASNEEFLLLDPNDIEEFNVLKDAATAAVYGARAGNGVILVTTKRGKIQDAKFSYTANFGWQQLTMLPHAVSSWENAQFENVARQNAGLDPLWSNEDINKFIAGNDPEYPNTDWWDLTLRDYAPQSQHNINVRGGTEKIKYFVSGGYYSQKGIYRSDDLENKKYNLRSNLDIKLTDNLDLGVGISLLENDYVGPSWDMANRNGHLGVMMLLYRSRPQFPGEYPDPTKFPAMGNDDLNPVSATKISDVGYLKWNQLTADTKLNLTYKLPLGFTAKANFNYNRVSRRDKRKENIAPAYWFDYDAEGNIVYHNHRNFNNYNWLYEKSQVSKNINQQYMLSWNKEFGNHRINALGVYEHLSSEGDFIDAQRIRYEFDLDYLFAGPDLDKSNNGRGWQDGRIGQIFSMDYSYKEKYLLGFNIRRDGSPKFPADTRWGTFPSISGGWRISQENFIKEKLPFINSLKLRASWGKLGYDNTGDYQYLSTYSIQPAQVMVDGVVRSGINADNVPNYNITWEKMTTTNIGLDYGLFNNKISGAIDAFYRKRSDVLGDRQVSLPDIVGATLPKENIEEYSNRGIEMSLQYATTVGEVRFSLGGNVSYSREKIEYIDQPEYASQEDFRRNNKIGQWSDTSWGYKADGVFTSQEEIDNWAIIDGRNNATVNVGDIKLIDYNGDGVINSQDNVIIGRGTSPDIIFGINNSISWNGFDFNMLWQGAGLYDIHYGASGDLSQPFRGGNAPFAEMYNGSYVPQNEWGMPANTDSHPTFPRFYWPGYQTHNTNANSSFWYKKGNYIRLKSIELGYNIPKKFINKFGVDNLKIFYSGYNVLTFSALDFYDPELQNTNGGNNAALNYPSTSTYSLGLILDF